MIDSPEILRLIETAPLFRGISRELLDPLLHKATLLTLKPGEKLLSPGIINEQVYILISGRMNVQVTPSLLDEPITMLTSGECVGEMSVLVDGLVSAYVIAATSCLSGFARKLLILLMCSLSSHVKILNIINVLRISK